MELFCGYCGYYGQVIFVHSHYQCPRCKNNIAPCCEGEVFQEDITEKQKNANSEESKNDSVEDTEESGD